METPPCLRPTTRPLSRAHTPDPGRTPPPAEAPQAPALPPEGMPAADGAGLRLLLRSRLYAGGGTAAFDPHFAPVREEAVLHLNPEDAAALGLGTGAGARLQGGSVILTASVRVDPDVEPGFALLPAHAFGGSRLGARVEVGPAARDGAVSAG